MKQFAHMLLLLITCLAFASCEYKDLCYDHNHWVNVRVVFDWSQCEEADPKGMTVLFYNQEVPESEPVRYDLTGRDGGMVRLIPGVYRAVAYNYDTETILYQEMDDLNTLEAYTRVSSIEEGTQLTRSGMPRAVSTEQEQVILEPDALWGSVSEPFTLVLSDESVTITLQPTPRTIKVDIEIYNVPNLNYTGQFGGALSGISPGVMMADGSLAEGKATQAFTCQVVDGNKLQMSVRIFGHCPHRDDGELEQHLLTIYAILADGSQWYYTVDVTAQMHDWTQPPYNEEEIHIYLDGLPVPKPIVNGSGLQPTIDGWKGEEIDVTM